MADGAIRIDVLANTDKFDRQINEIDKKIQKEEEKKIVLGAKIEVQEQELERARQKADELANVYQKMKNLQDAIAEGKATPEQFSMANDIKNAYGNMLELETSLLKASNKQDEINIKTNEMKLKYQEINNTVSQYKEKIEGIRLQKHQKDVEGLKGSIGGVAKSFSKSVKNAAKLALGIFGIRSAYLMLRQASSQLGQYDKQYATDLEYIRWILVQAIAPILKAIINYVLQGLRYIYLILDALFGIGQWVDLSADAFARMKKNASGVSSAVKEIKKDLLGFDEINRLTDEGVVAGAAGVGTPSLDIAGTGTDLPEWIKWLTTHKTTVLTVLGTIAGIIAGIKIAAFLASIKSIFTVLQGMSSLQIFGIITGVIVAIIGLVQAIPALINYIQNPTWENFKKVLQGMELVLLGIGVALVAIDAANPLGWIVLAIGAFATLGDYMTRTKDKTEAETKAQEKLNQVLSESRQATDNYVRAVDNAEAAEKALIEAEKQHKLSGQQLYYAVQDGTLDYKNMNKAQREVYKAYLDTINAQDDLKKATEEVSKATKNEQKVFDEVYGTTIPDSVADGFGKALNSLDLFTKKWNSTINKLKTEITVGATYGLNAALSVAAKAKQNAKGAIMYPYNVPKLALGGIINMPGRGVPYNGAIIGERGAEAVVPLTDTQQMELLGATIGKYITVNANIVNTMNGRIISRELKQVQSEQDFAYNT